MDDTGIADAFYTVLSIGIVLVAALAVSGVVLSSVEQGRGAADRLAGQGGVKPGLYSFYYAVDGPRSDLKSGDASDIVLKRLACEGVDGAIAFNASAAPPAAPLAMGAVIWSGYLYAPSDGDYMLRLSGNGAAWLWVDGDMAAGGRFSENGRPKELELKLSKGRHAFKAKYVYQDLSSASCSLSWKQGRDFVPVRPFYR